MGTTPIGHSLIAASLISLVLIAVLGEPVSVASATTSAKSGLDQAVTREIEIAQATPIELPSGRENVAELKTQMAALMRRIDSLEAQLKQEEVILPPLQHRSLVASSAKYRDTPKSPKALEERWVAQTTDPNWEARVDGQLVDLVADSQRLGLGKIDLGGADCRGDLCKLNVTSSMHPAMVQHLLTQFVGNTQIVADASLGQGGLMAFVQQRP